MNLIVDKVLPWILGFSLIRVKVRLRIGTAYTILSGAKPATDPDRLTQTMSQSLQTPEFHRTKGEGGSISCLYSADISGAISD